MFNIQSIYNNTTQLIYNNIVQPATNYAYGNPDTVIMGAAGTAIALGIGTIAIATTSPYVATMLGISSIMSADFGISTYLIGLDKTLEIHEACLNDAITNVITSLCDAVSRGIVSGTNEAITTTGVPITTLQQNIFTNVVKETVSTLYTLPISIMAFFSSIVKGEIAQEYYSDASALQLISMKSISRAIGGMIKYTSSTLALGETEGVLTDAITGAINNGQYGLFSVLHKLKVIPDVIYEYLSLPIEATDGLVTSVLTGDYSNLLQDVITGVHSGSWMYFGEKVILPEVEDIMGNTYTTPSADDTQCLVGSDDLFSSDTNICLA